MTHDGQATNGPSVCPQSPTPLALREPDYLDVPAHLPSTLADYLEFVDCVGRAVCEDKQAVIAEDDVVMVKRVGIGSGAYIERTADRRHPAFVRPTGRADRLRRAAAARG